MSILEEAITLAEAIGLKVRTGVFSGEKAPDEYLVITPMSDIDFCADNEPTIEVQEARLSLYSKGNYQQRKNQLAQELRKADMTITAKRFIEYETDAGYYHYAIDIAKEYDLED